MTLIMMIVQELQALEIIIILTCDILNSTLKAQLKTLSEGMKLF